MLTSAYAFTTLFAFSLINKDFEEINTDVWEMAFVDDYMYLDGNDVYKAKIKVVD